MTTFWQDIVEQSHDELIIAVVIGEMGWPDYNEEVKEIPKEKKGVILTPIEAEKYLSYEYSTGFGAPECHCVYAWTENWVIFVSTYDGSTGVNSIPRMPSDIMPNMFGGG